MTHVIGMRTGNLMSVLALLSNGFGAHGGVSGYNRELLGAQVSALCELPRILTSVRV